MQNLSLLKKQFVKRQFFLFAFLTFIIVPSFSFAQPVGATISNPIVMGTYGAGTFSYTDTKNNATTNGFGNDYGQESDDIYYQFTLQSTTSVTITNCNSTPSTFFTYLWLLNSNGELIAYNTYSSPSPSPCAYKAYIRRTLPPGTYYIVSEGSFNSSGTIVTNVNFDIPPPEAIGAKMSNPIVMGIYGEGTFSYTNTQDNNPANGFGNDYGQASDDIFYEFTVEGTSSVTISHCASAIDTYLSLLNSTGVLIVRSDDNGPLCTGIKGSISTTLAPGKYFIVSEGWNTRAGSITTAVNLTVQTPPIALETNNFIKTWKATAPEINGNNLIARPITDVKQTSAYFDGLGREVQTVHKQSSMDNQKAWNYIRKETDLDNAAGPVSDLVNISGYDQYGRRATNYLPYAASSNAGTFKTNGLSEQESFNQTFFNGQNEHNFYSQTEFEPSPLNRITKEMPAGNSWVGNSRGTEYKYWLNTAVDEVKKWKVQDVNGSFGTYAIEGIYGDYELSKTVSIDAHGVQIIQFTDKRGKLILKKVQLTAVSDDGSGSGHSGWLCTYNIYDDLGQLRAVIQPEGVKRLAENGWDVNYSSGVLLNEQFFRYEYDARGLVVMKKVPGATELWMAYDRWDRLILTQDGNQRLVHDWGYIKYDDLNRPIISGLYNDAVNVTLDQINAHLLATESSFVKNEISNSATIGYTLTQTYPSVQESSVLKVTHYDDYDWTNNVALIFRNFDGSFASHFLPEGLEAPFPQTINVSNSVRGKVTGISTRVIGAGLLTSVNFYDQKGRLVQTKSENITGGCDVLTKQYGFAGDVLVTVLKNEKLGTNPQTSKLITRYELDHLGRLVTVKKEISNLSNGGTLRSTLNGTKLKQSYNKLGQLAQTAFDPEYFYGQAIYDLNVLNYEYNIHGWLLGMNKNFLKDKNSSGYVPNAFAYELGYDKATTSPGSQSGQVHYNSNISNLIWKSAGDGARRKYTFSYDKANRLGKANFSQNTDPLSGAVWNTQDANFSVHGFDADNEYNLKYDANGNIQGMVEHGIKGINADVNIDALRYEYFPNSNKLRMVHDDNSDPNTKLGDFHNGNEGYLGTDYGYDRNGNTVTDRNKYIEGSIGIDVTSGGGMVYNHLDLPTTITIDGKGSIQYVYDAFGNKLKKIAIDNTIASNVITTTTTYFGPFVYESKQYSNPGVGEINYTDELQYIAQEYGRTRIKRDANRQISEWPSDYFIKDHLGSVRMVLTDEYRRNQYPSATFEDATLSNEQLYYENVNVGRTARPGAFYTSSTSGNFVQVLTKNSQSTGVGKLLKVMAGDNLHATVRYYIPTATIDNSNANGIASVINQLLILFNGAGAPGVVKGVETSTTNNLSNNSAFTSFLAPQGSGVNSTVPKAYLNILFFDEQFKFVPENSEVTQVTVQGSGQTITRNFKVTPKNGYVYIFVSNESNNLVYFDNFKITHDIGRLLQEDHYYPFGLTMAGISSKQLNSLENKKLFNGIEQTTELGLNQYDAFYRNLDPQIGRFWQIDPQVNNLESYTPYESMGNNPISNVDPLGDFPTSRSAWWYRLTHSNWWGASIHESPTLGDFSLDKVFSTADQVIVGSTFGNRNKRYDNSLLGRVVDYFYERSWRTKIGNVQINQVDGAIRYLPEALGNEIIGQLTFDYIAGAAIAKAYRGARLLGTAAETVTQVESKVFLVTKEGVVLPKGAKIPTEFVENPFRSSNYGIIENGKFVEKLRIDAATPPGMKGPNFSHYHLNGGGNHLTGDWPWR
jgi:RHS repeat-associated protein